MLTAIKFFVFVFTPEKENMPSNGKLKNFQNVQQIVRNFHSTKLQVNNKAYAFAWQHIVPVYSDEIPTYFFKIFLFLPEV